VTKQPQTAMQRGREKAAKAARRAAVKRVKEYRAWLRRDNEITALLKRGKRAKRERMPCIPSDNDFKVAREEGL
jgi:hypothetical protein